MPSASLNGSVVSIKKLTSDSESFGTGCDKLSALSLLRDRLCSGTVCGGHSCNNCGFNSAHCSVYCQSTARDFMVLISETRRQAEHFNIQLEE